MSSSPAPGYPARIWALFGGMGGNLIKAISRTLTDLKARDLKPKEKPFKVFDFDGLYVLVNPGGSKLWRVKYRLHGKDGLLSLGAYPAIRLLQARQMRGQAGSQIAGGIRPNEVKREKAALIKLKLENTFEAAAQNRVEKDMDCWEGGRHASEDDFFPAGGESQRGPRKNRPTAG